MRRARLALALAVIAPILVLAPPASAKEHGSVSTYTGSGSFPTGWVVGGGLAVLLLAGLLLRYVTKFTSLRGTTIVLRGSPPSR